MASKQNFQPGNKLIKKNIGILILASIGYRSIEMNRDVYIMLYLPKYHFRFQLSLYYVIIFLISTYLLVSSTYYHLVNLILERSRLFTLTSLLLVELDFSMRIVNVCGSRYSTYLDTQCSAIIFDTVTHLQSPDFILSISYFVLTILCSELKFPQEAFIVHL